MPRSYAELETYSFVSVLIYLWILGWMSSFCGSWAIQSNFGLEIKSASILSLISLALDKISFYFWSYKSCHPVAYKIGNSFTMLSSSFFTSTFNSSIFILRLDFSIFVSILSSKTLSFKLLKNLYEHSSSYQQF